MPQWRCVLVQDKNYLCYFHYSYVYYFNPLVPASLSQTVRRSKSGKYEKVSLGEATPVKLLVSSVSKN
jgi:hypothetical protein